MSDASQFPITQAYGYDPSYPLNNHFHNGLDYGCPTGTPVVVNGVTIGLSGATGYATGPHLHVGRWLGGTVTNPGVGGGFKFNSAVVTQISSDATNGNYVRIQGDGASWVYLHLSNNNLVKVGQVLSPQGEDMIPNKDYMDALFEAFWRRAGDDNEAATWVGKKEFPELIDALRSQQPYLDTVNFIKLGTQASAENWQLQITELKTQLAAAQKQSGGFTATDRATAVETNNIVKQIWQKISGVFK